MNVLLTGGSRGIGRAAVRALHAAGATVLFTYNRESEQARSLCDELGSRAFAERCDMANHDALPSLVDTALERLGSIDVLVNNAGIYTENPFFGNDYASWRAGWQHTFDVNLFGAANLTFLVMQHMRTRKHGKIVNVVSRSSHRGELTYADYAASKAALNNLTKSIARSCASDGIIAISIAPGFIETDMAAEALEEYGASVKAEIPMGYVGTPGEVASIIAFFASDAAKYANGATIDVNGGSYVR
ncbi:MAG TPA: SDR family oxidoreductase [Candidatus Baltobacteraceae bacterium]|nr:SDR family oxidoreductase [Candidatus Baltobacteraceae bacterium]